jgi:hypothetical protein
MQVFLDVEAVVGRLPGLAFASKKRELAGPVRIGHWTCHCGKKAPSRVLIHKQ